MNTSTINTQTSSATTRNDRSRILLLGAVVVSAVLLVGLRPERNQSPSAHGSRVKVYRAISDLDADASAVAVLTPTGASRVDWIRDLPYEVADFTVRSKSPASSTLGSSMLTLILPSDRSIQQRLLSGSSLAWITQLRYADGTTISDRWVAIGDGAGVFSSADTSPGAKSTYQRADTLSRDLPTAVAFDAGAVRTVPGSPS